MVKKELHTFVILVHLSPWHHQYTSSSTDCVTYFNDACLSLSRNNQKWSMIVMISFIWLVFMPKDIFELEIYISQVFLYLKKCTGQTRLVANNKVIRPFYLNRLFRFYFFLYMFHSWVMSKKKNDCFFFFFWNLFDNTCSWFNVLKSWNTCTVFSKYWLFQQHEILCQHIKCGWIQNIQGFKSRKCPLM